MEQQRSGTRTGQSAGDGNGNHAAHGVVAYEEESAAHAGDFVEEAVQGRVGEAEDAIAERGVGHDEAFDLAKIGGTATEGGEQAQIDEVIARKGGRGDRDGAGEEVTLEERTAFREGNAHFFVSLDFFGKKLDGGTTRHGINLAAGPSVGGAEVNFDEVC
jgi:hypothetical protein